MEGDYVSWQVDVPYIKKGNEKLFPQAVREVTRFAGRTAGRGGPPDSFSGPSSRKREGLPGSCCSHEEKGVRPPLVV